MYEWLEQELIGIEPALSEAKAKKSTDAGYGRVDKAACWLLLSRLYLNSEIYTGTAQWQKAKEYADKVIKSSYRLNTVGKGGWTAYQMLFMGDNGETDLCLRSSSTLTSRRSDNHQLGYFPVLDSWLL